MDTLAPQIGRTVRRYRQSAKLSQEELADRAGLHRTYISLLERGRRNASVDALSKIAGVLGVPASRLLADAEGEGA